MSDPGKDLAGGFRTFAKALPGQDFANPSLIFANHRGDLMLVMALAPKQVNENSDIFSDARGVTH